jgi:hypothetical protein
MVRYTKITGVRKVDFPMRLVRPQILKDLGEAMKLKIFDEIGILPQTRSHARDPMVIGRVVRPGPNRWSNVHMSFLITWWVDTRGL